MNNNALIKLTEEKIGDNTALSTFVEKAKMHTNCLFPETVLFTDPALKFGAAMVTVDTNLDKYGNNKDIYKNSDGTYCLHLSKINEISQHATIQVTDSRILERKVDEKGLVVFIEHQAKGRLRYIDGSVKEDIATGKYDYYRDKEKYNSEKQINGRRSHAEALAESNAKTRLYNKLNFKLPSSFTLEELRKPFLIPFVIEDKEELLKQLPEADQFEARKKLTFQRLGIADKIYSPSESQQLPSSDGGNSKTPTPPETIPDADFQDIPEDKSEINKYDEIKIIANEFRDVPQPARTDQILKLVESKNYADPKGIAITASRIEKQSVDNQIAFLERLMSLDVVNDEEEL